MTAVAPALAASSTPSGKGKKASDPTTLPLAYKLSVSTEIIGNFYPGFGSLGCLND